MCVCVCVCVCVFVYMYVCMYIFFYTFSNQKYCHIETFYQFNSFMISNFFSTILTWQFVDSDFKTQGEATKLHALFADNSNLAQPFYQFGLSNCGYTISCFLSSYIGRSYSSILHHSQSTFIYSFLISNLSLLLFYFCFHKELLHLTFIMIDLCLVSFWLFLEIGLVALALSQAWSNFGI